jgi:hypothetical protein
MSNETGNTKGDSISENDLESKQIKLDDLYLNEIGKLQVMRFWNAAVGLSVNPREFGQECNRALQTGQTNADSKAWIDERILGGNDLRNAADQVIGDFSLNGISVTKVAMNHYWEGKSIKRYNSLLKDGEIEGDGLAFRAVGEKTIHSPVSTKPLTETIFRWIGWVIPENIPSDYDAKTWIRDVHASWLDMRQDLQREQYTPDDTEVDQNLIDACRAQM